MTQSYRISRGAIYSDNPTVSSPAKGDQVDAMAVAGKSTLRYVVSKFKEHEDKFMV